MKIFFSFSKNFVKIKDWTFPVVCYFTWKLEFVSNILWMILANYYCWPARTEPVFGRDMQINGQNLGLSQTDDLHFYGMVDLLVILVICLFICLLVCLFVSALSCFFGYLKKTCVPMLASEYNLCQICSSSQKSIFSENTIKL